MPLIEYKYTILECFDTIEWGQISVNTGGSSFNALVVLLALVGGGLYFSFGTLAPCGILRETVRLTDGFAAILPDSIVDMGIEANIGPLNPTKCTGVLLSNLAARHENVASAKVAPLISPAPKPENAIQNRVEAAIQACKMRRLSGV